MKIVVLTDDNVIENKKLLAEHGLCFYIEDSGKKILFDTGFSDVFIKNAIELGINLLDLDYIILSHGHYDHTWGLFHYLQFLTSSSKKGYQYKKPTLITHPSTFLEKYEDGEGEIGSIISLLKLKKFFDVHLSTQPYNISQNLIYMGEIPRTNCFEANEPMGKVLINGEYCDDFVMEDSALIYSKDNFLSIITGCSHSGICNIIEYVKKLSGDVSIKSIIGGFHLLGTVDEKLDRIVDYMYKQNILKIYPCHCIDFEAKKKLSDKLNVENIGVGAEIHL